MTTEQDYRMRLAWQTEERVELTREEIEAELGPFECATDEDARCVLSTHAGAQFVAWLSGPELNVEELVETDALRTCNCCDVNRADERSPAGYCVACERSARAGEPCWHEEVGLAAHDGAQFVAWPSGPEAEARLNVEEVEA